MGWCTYSIGADRFGRVFYKNKNFYRVVMHGDWMSVLHKIIDDKKYMEKIFNAGLVRFDYLGEFLNFSQVLKLDSVYSFSYMKHRVKQQNIDALKMLCQLSLVLYDKDLTTCNFHEGDINAKGCIPVFTDLGAVDNKTPNTLVVSINRIGYLIDKYILVYELHGL